MSKSDEIRRSGGCSQGKCVLYIHESLDNIKDVSILEVSYLNGHRSHLGYCLMYSSELHISDQIKDRTLEKHASSILIEVVLHSSIATDRTTDSSIVTEDLDVCITVLTWMSCTDSVIHRLSVDSTVITTLLASSGNL